MATPNSFFYDGQIRRFLTQFIRIMSRFQVEFGQDRDGNVTLQQVPVIYGDSSRQAAAILAGNSENTTPTVPAIAVYISGFDYDRARVQEPYHVSKLNIRNREYNSTTDEWGSGEGDAFTVERMMPVPYKLTLKVDIWTSNTTQKLQLIEQMTPLFNPALEIQSTDNYVDWTSLSAIYLVGTTWSSRTVPVGAGGQIDIATLTFELPIWLTLPAKVKKLGVIQKIIASIYDEQGLLVDDITSLSANALMARMVLTPLNFGIVYSGNTLQLYRLPQHLEEDVNASVIVNGESYAWHAFADIYDGAITNGITEVRLEQPDGSTVVGTVSYHPTDVNLLIFNQIVDTIPANTIAPINAIIDPFNMPVDTTFINATTGVRYLILHAIGDEGNLDPALAWRGTDGSNLIAEANDIIEYDGTKWFVAFSAVGNPTIKYVTNLKSGIQFKWMPDEKQWSRSTEGAYGPGNWTIILTTI